MLPYNKDLKERAQQLRNNMTDAERLFWSRVRMRQLGGVQFYRQKIIGNYIVDFYCPKAKLIVEIDGGHHFDDPVKTYDVVRDKHMSALGLNVMRFTSLEVIVNITAVVEAVQERTLFFQRGKRNLSLL